MCTIEHMRDKNRIAYLENLWSVIRDFYRQEDYSFAQILDKAQITYYDEDSIAYDKLKNLINKEKPPFTDFSISVNNVSSDSTNDSNADMEIFAILKENPDLRLTQAVAIFEHKE